MSTTTAGLRMELEYERDPFRRAEIEARQRLRRLLAVVAETIKGRIE